MKRHEYADIDEIKEDQNEATLQFIDMELAKMHNLVQQFETQEDYWFVKYYEPACFSIFTPGIVTAKELDDLCWMAPDQIIDKEKIETALEFLKCFLKEEIWALFQGREELVFRLFKYGTYQRHLDVQNNVKY